MNSETNREIYDKINQAVKILCEVYDLLNKNNENENDNNNINFINEKSFLSVRQFVEKHNNFTDGQIRHYILKNLNGFKEKVTKRIGNKILLNEKSFFEWVEN